MKRNLANLGAKGILGTIGLACAVSFGQSPSPQVASEPVADGWRTASPRDELRPTFSFKRNGGTDGKACLIIQADSREGLDGYWTRSFAVNGGRPYRFSAWRKVENVESPRRS